MVTEAVLMRLPRERLLDIAAELGISAVGRASSYIIQQILMKQGEMAGRSAEPLEVRVTGLEDAVARIESMVLEIGTCFAELDKTVARLARMNGVQHHPDVKDIALKYRARRPLPPPSIILRHARRSV